MAQTRKKKNASKCHVELENSKILIRFCKRKSTVHSFRCTRTETELKFNLCRLVHNLHCLTKHIYYNYLQVQIQNQSIYNGNMI